MTDKSRDIKDTIPFPYIPPAIPDHPGYFKVRNEPQKGKKKKMIFFLNGTLIFK